MLHTFSPNWYRPQCVMVTNNYMYYASNYILYQYSLNDKKVQQQLCFREIAMLNKINYKDIKIISIVSHSNEQQQPQYLYVAINQPYIFRVQIILSIMSIQRLIKTQPNITPDYLYLATWNNLVISSGDILLLYTFGQNLISTLKTGTQQSKDKIKSIFQNDKYHIVLYLRGTIQIWDAQFIKTLKKVHLQNSQIILSCDIHFCNDSQTNRIALLTRNKQNQYLTWFDFEFHQDVPNQNKNKINEICQKLRKIHLQFHYPKKVHEKNKELFKAALSIKIINQSQIILSGKLGEVYTIFLNQLDTLKKLQLRPFSYLQQARYQNWPDSKHYKQIYEIKIHRNKLYLISIDHNLSIWQIIQKQKLSQLKHLWSIKFLTTGVTSIFYSDCDPMTIFLLLRDSIVRSFSPLQEGNHFLNEYWKFTKKFKIKKVVSHLKIPGITGMLTDQQKIIIYDIYQDRLIKVIDLPQQTNTISFQLSSIIPILQTIYKLQNTKQYQSLNLFNKQLPNNVVMMVQMKDIITIIIFQDNNQKSLQFTRDKKLQRIDKCKYWNELTLLTSICKNNQLNLIISHKNKIFQYSELFNQNTPRNIFKCVSNTNELYIIFYKSNKITIRSMSFSIDKLEEISKKDIETYLNIDQIVVDYDTYNIAIYNQRDNNIQIMDIRYPQLLKIYSYSTKIQCLSFYKVDYLVVASKDQSIKVIKQTELNIDQKKMKKKNIQLKIKDQVQPHQTELVNIQKYQLIKEEIMIDKQIDIENQNI